MHSKKKNQFTNKIGSLLFCAGNPIIITHLPKCSSKSIPSAIFPLAIDKNTAPLPHVHASR